MEGDSWCDLPVDISNEIEKRFLYVEQIRFRSVCKNWRSNTNPVKHVAGKLPWVISFADNYGAGIVRRRTLVLQLHKTEDGSQEYAEFLHLPRRKFTDFVVNLTLIDLPCLTKVDVEGQAETIVQDIENMVRSYVEKLDLMDKGTNALDVDIIGVGCYSSKDLWTWRNEGIVLAAKETNETHDLYKLNVLERPKVVYNEKTGKYVMWMHINDCDYTKASVGVAISDY
ncbi:hypothetical protein LWI28_004083 [Acer negundo]|uniref:Dynamin GTPase domain-containing protein n=1 Tax=Acer negundo TaxID=4023 RepID=A0AAD5J3I0_ACENE|nr:hypothetical protein LWI28_004083 [Acer negundo]